MINDVYTHGKCECRDSNYWPEWNTDDHGPARRFCAQSIWERNLCSLVEGANSSKASLQVASL